MAGAAQQAIPLGYELPRRTDDPSGRFIGSESRLRMHRNSIRRAKRMKAAKALGLTVPAALLSRADTVIE